MRSITDTYVYTCTQVFLKSSGFSDDIHYKICDNGIFWSVQRHVGRYGMFLNSVARQHIDLRQIDLVPGKSLRPEICGLNERNGWIQVVLTLWLPNV